MIIKAKVKQSELRKIMIGDTHELHITDGARTSKFRVKVVDVVRKKVNCNGCTCLLDHDEVFTHSHRSYCEDCYIRRKR